METRTRLTVTRGEREKEREGSSSGMWINDPWTLTTGWGLTVGWWEVGAGRAGESNGRKIGTTEKDQQ